MDGAKKQAASQKKVKLLEEIPTSKAQPPAQAKPSMEQISSMILDKLNQLESTHGGSAADDKTSTSAAAASTQASVGSSNEGADLMAKLEAIFGNGEADNKQKCEEMLKFYAEVVAEELKKQHKAAVQLKLQQELLEYKVHIVYSEQVKKAQLIVSKYEILTREYQGQNKTLKENHERIIAGELAKRGEIISNFDNHLKQIRQQIREDAAKLEADGGSEAAKENAKLKEQYEALQKEIDEKTKLMDEQIVEKERAGGSIEEEMSKKIAAQEEEIKRQVVVYQEQQRIKRDEEAELKKVLEDYRKKHEEFAKAMKKSRDTFKVYETEIKNMNQRAQELA